MKSLKKKLIRDNSTQPVGSFARMVTKLQQSQNLNTVFVFHAARVGVGYGIGDRAEFFFSSSVKLLWNNCK